VNALFIAIVGSIALGVGLAFGLGGRETAAQILTKWYAKAQEKTAEMKNEKRIIGAEEETVAQAGSWPTGGYPGASPANRKHGAEGG